MSLPYNPPTNYAPGDTITSVNANGVAQDLLTLDAEATTQATDIANLKNGTAIQSGAITTAKLADSSVTADKLNDNILNFFTDEVNTGVKWYNGKDIYKKLVISPQLPITTTTASVEFTTNITDIDSFIDMQGLIYVQNSATDASPSSFTWAQRIGSVYNTETYGCYFRFSDKYLRLSFTGVSATKRAVAYINVFYTKT